MREEAKKCPCDCRADHREPARISPLTPPYAIFSQLKAIPYGYIFSRNREPVCTFDPGPYSRF